MTKPTSDYSRALRRSILLTLLLTQLICFSTIGISQSSETETQASAPQSAEIEIPIIQKIDSRGAGFGYCGYSKVVGPVVSEDEFRELLAAGSKRLPSTDATRCAFLNRLEVDFDRQTLLRYGVNGDCFVRATARVFRKDSSRSYVLRITKIYGGCRAGGSFEGWLVIEKLNPDYKIEVELFERNESGVTRRVGKDKDKKMPRLSIAALIVFQ